jgi:hypothetical protein
MAILGLVKIGVKFIGLFLPRNSKKISEKLGKIPIKTSMISRLFSGLFKIMKPM